jgi:hypothetical protein
MALGTKRALPLALGVSLLPATALAGAWVTPAGDVRLQLHLMRQQTRERYFLDGRRIPYFFDGENRTSAAFLDVSWGVRDRLEAGVQAAIFRLAFDDVADQRRSTGPGDLRLGVRYNLLRAPLVLTLGARAKLPTGDFDNDAEIVPVGEGQRDIEGFVEVGHSLWPKPGYWSAGIGYRHRAENSASGIRPGDEVFWYAEAGWTLKSRLALRLVGRGLHGRESTSFGLAIPSLRRKAVYLDPALDWSFGGGRAVSVAVPFTVAGRNWPAGPALGVGFRQTF